MPPGIRVTLVVEEKYTTMYRSSPAKNSSQTNSTSSLSGMKLSDPDKKRKSASTAATSSSSEDEGEEEEELINKKIKSKSSNKNNSSDGDDDDDDDSSTSTTTKVVAAAAAPPKQRPGGRAKKTTNNNKKRKTVVTGYNLFIKEQLPIARAKSGQAHLRNIVPMVAKKWNNLPLALRQPYQDAAQRLSRQKQQQQQQQQHARAQQKQHDANKSKKRVRGGKGGGNVAITVEQQDDDEELEEDADESSSTMLAVIPSQHGHRARRRAAPLDENDDDDDVEILKGNKSTTNTNTNKQRAEQRVPPRPLQQNKKTKRPYCMSAYNIFVQQQLPFARQDFDDNVHLQFIIPHVAQAWREMDDHLRERYQEQSRLWKEQDEQKYKEEEEEEEENSEESDEEEEYASSSGRRRSARASPPTVMFGFSDHRAAAAAGSGGLFANITNTQLQARRNGSRAARRSANENAHQQVQANNLKKNPSSNSSTGGFSPYKIPGGYGQPLDDYFEDFILESANDAFLLEAAVDSLCLLQDNTRNGHPPGRHALHCAKFRNTENTKNCKKKVPAKKKRVGDTFGTQSSDSSDSSPFSQDSPVSLEGSSSPSNNTNIGSDDNNSENCTGSRADWKRPRGKAQHVAAPAAAAAPSLSRFSRPVGRPPVGAVFCTQTGKYLPRNNVAKK
jgi:HMG (high mobility group) box/HMG-box domain